MSEDQTVETGKEGMLWYGTCTYWTDDWEALSNEKGIPICPDCGGPGFEISIQAWNEGIEKHEADGNPGYGKFVETLKENCHGKKADFNDLWELYQKEHDDAGSYL